MSIDHFIPWSFVLHDRLWNLIPTSRSINSSKSDLLPPLETYLDSFINLQYRAYTTAVKIGYKNNILEDYLTLSENNFTTSSLVPPPGDRGPGVIVPPESEFKEIMQNTIIPLYRIARNQGFTIWTAPQIKID
jgi:hypothetical protein